MWTENLRSLLGRVFTVMRVIVRATVASALVLSTFRLAFLVRHAAPGWPYRAADVGRALLMGARFDLKVSILAALPLALLAASGGRGRWRRLPAAWVALAAFALAVTAMINDGYYAFYHAPIDPIVFGLYDDDTAAVFRSLWTDHRILLGPLSALALALVQAWLVTRPPRRLPGLPVQAVAVLLVPLLAFLAVRGRVGGFPLNAKDFAVSTEPFLNASVPNGAMALLVASEERGTVSIDGDAYQGLRARGFAHPGEAAAALGLAAASATDAEVAEALFTRTPENPYAAAHPPHVVLVVMESWGADLLRYHSARNDLLGRLAPHLARGLVFRHFLAGQNGTHPSLEALLLNTPITPLTTGEPGHVRFEQAAALPFKAAGYRTVFGMGWSSTWRGFGRALRNQGFDEVRDVNDVLAVVPDAPVGTWGVPDGALLRWAEERLRQADASGEHLLLVLMTASNHTPHFVPPGYALRPLDLGVFAGRAMGEPELRLPQLQTYQYACDALGGFLDALAEDGLAARTVVAATGDHNTREFFQYPDLRDLPRRDGVPLFLAVPAAYLAGRTPDVERWGSHRDIFPTLAGLQGDGQVIGSAFDAVGGLALQIQHPAVGVTFAGNQHFTRVFAAGCKGRGKHSGTGQPHAVFLGKQTTV